MATGRKGRPRRQQPKPGERVSLGLRVTPQLKEALDRAAEASGRSQSQEAEFRLERSFLDQRLMIEALGLAYDPRLTGIAFAIAEVMKAAGQHAGFVEARTLDGSRDWVDSPYAYDQAAQAANAVIEAMRPEGDPSPPPAAIPLTTIGDAIPDFGNLNAQVGKSHATSIIEEVASGHARNSRTVERARFLHRVNPLSSRLRKFCDEEFLSADSHIGDGQ